jgi:hypothetical protein
MNLQLFVLSVVLNIAIFFLFRHFIINELISQRLLNVGLGFIIFFIIAEYAKLYFATINFITDKKNKNLTKLNTRLANTANANTMIFIYLFYAAIALSSVIYYPSFPSIPALFIIIFVLQYLLLIIAIFIFVNFLIGDGFKYRLENPDVLIDYLIKLSPYHSLTDESHGENRLSKIEMKAIDNIFKQMMRKELKKELKFILYHTLLFWSRLFSLVNTIILSLLLWLIV